ncbi:MAG: hypothetical protein NMNS01_29570 [Nitrosomonas sp.]|nr:MAG: hypothetical protein NMNS01_29570 [Nitrosomonas sp.]
MSSKQFISAEEHLAKLGVTVQQAQDFINNNVGRPEIIFEAADQFGVTNNMLSEITNISINNVRDYFTVNGKDSNKLDRTSILINSDTSELEILIDFNNNSSFLSNAALGEAVLPLLFNVVIYGPTFGPIISLQSADGIYDAEELGVGHLGNIPATNESIESLFYGTLINIFTALDESELNQINTFPEDGDLKGFQALLINALSEPPSPVAWTDEELANQVAQKAAEIINEYWIGETELVGVLDLSFLGLATA